MPYRELATEVSAENVDYNMANYARLAFIEQHTNDVGTAALRHYVEDVPNTGNAVYLAMQLDESLQG